MVMKEKLFNYEIISLVIACFSTLLGVVIFLDVFVAPPANDLATGMEHWGLGAIIFGLINGIIFWPIRRLLNR
jgi:hypothetical protein